MENSSVLKELQQVELGIYKEVVKICDKYSLTYYMSAGTFLGAVRHKGFIPWDDDMDMRMPRTDYEKLISVLPHELSKPYVLKHYSRDKSVHRYFARVENENVHFQRTHTVKPQINNAWIDIFPLDGMPDNRIHKAFRKFYLMHRKLWMQLSVFDEIIDIKKKRPLRERIIIFFAMHTPIQRCLSWDKLVRKMDKALKAYPLDKSDVYMNFCSAYKYKDIIPKALYGKGAMYQFEDTELRGPEDYDSFLKILYGDYMKMPPLEARNKHFIDSNSIEFVN